MHEDDDLVLLESDGVKGKYLCLETNEEIEAIGTIAVPREKEVAKYRGTVTWSKNSPITKQIMAMKKICSEYNIISNKDIIAIAREKGSWTFGEFFGVDAANILELAQKYNVNVEMVDINSKTKLVI